MNPGGTLGQSWTISGPQPNPAYQLTGSGPWLPPWQPTWGQAPHTSACARQLGPRPLPVLTLGWLLGPSTQAAPLPTCAHGPPAPPHTPCRAGHAGSGSQPDSTVMQEDVYGPYSTGLSLCGFTDIITPVEDLVPCALLQQGKRILVLGKDINMRGCNYTGVEMCTRVCLCL